MQFVHLCLAAIVGFAMAAPNGELNGLQEEKRVRTRYNYAYSSRGPYELMSWTDFMHIYRLV